MTYFFHAFALEHVQMPDGNIKKSLKGSMLAFSAVDSNFVIAFGTATRNNFDFDAPLLAHEIGHCFGLKHTFDVSEAVFPDKPVFSDPNWNKDNPDKGEHHLCYSGTMDNLMDYTNGANTKFQRKAFFITSGKR